VGVSRSLLGLGDTLRGARGYLLGLRQPAL
jgi:hypothetical protein